MSQMSRVWPQIVPLGDSSLLVRFGASLEDEANKAALALAARLKRDPVEGVVEVVPSLVSVLVRYDAFRAEPFRIAGEIGLRLGSSEVDSVREHFVPVRFGGAEGPDLEDVADSLNLTIDGFIERLCVRPLRVLATGFAPGFVYAGFHPESLNVPRRQQVRPLVPVGSVLFAARQTAIAATDIPTGWHVIGRTEFRNFDPLRDPPTTIAAGDLIRLGAVL